MKIKRLCSFLLVLLITAGLVCAPFCASASVTIKNGNAKVVHGNPRSTSPQYSMAWLDNLVIRDSTNQIASARIVPQSEYPYSHTFDDFIEEVNNYSILNLINEDTVSAAYTQVINVLYYTVVALGMTQDSDTMKAYVRSRGITIPPLETAEDEIKVAVVYAAIKYNAVYVLYDKKIDFPQGISLDSAICLILSEITGTFLPSGVDTVTGFAVNSIKTYITQFDSLPISSNPGNSEIFHWAKVITAASNDYKVPLEAYDKATAAQKEYVDYAYFASILDTVYNLHIDPIRLVVADKSTEKNAVAKLILQTMLKESGVDYADDATCEELFKEACENGKFPLNEEFYSDIFNYNLYVVNDCTKIWFTPFVLADQLGGNNANLSMTLAGNPVAPSQTVAYSFDSAKDTDDIELKVTYADAASSSETVTYKFHIIRKSLAETKSSTAQNSVVAGIQDAINSVIPADNENANKIVDGIMSSVDSILSITASSNKNSVLTTYGSETSSTVSSNGGYNSSPKKGSDGIDFGYLEELMSETYLNGEQAANAISKYSSMTATTESKTFVQKTVQTIKENPEVAAAPTGIIALGGFAGYIWTKRKKTSSEAENGENTDKKSGSDD